LKVCEEGGDIKQKFPGDNNFEKLTHNQTSLRINGKKRIIIEMAKNSRTVTKVSLDDGHLYRAKK
jgi:plasmid maintenance system killer protein